MVYRGLFNANVGALKEGGDPISSRSIGASATVC